MEPQTEFSERMSCVNIIYLVVQVLKNASVVIFGGLGIDERLRSLQERV
jgi:hypothetical protein